MISAFAISTAHGASAGDQRASAAATIAIPQIHISAGEAGSLVIAASVLGLAEGDVTATLNIERRGRGGHATTSQARALHLKNGRSDTIATLTINFGPGDTLRATAIVTRDGAVISTATLTAGGDD